MYKSDLVRCVAKDTRLTQRVVSDVITVALKEMTYILSKAEDMVFPGFGTFDTRVRAAAHERSFKTGKTVRVPAMRLACFRSGELLKKAARRSK